MSARAREHLLLADQHDLPNTLLTGLLPRILQLLLALTELISFSPNPGTGEMLYHRNRSR
jgi:hypothetical protein